MVRIIATRPEHSNASWCHKLAAQLDSLSSITYQLIEKPLIEIVPCERDDEIQSIKNIVQDLDCYSRAIFISQNAVAHAFDWIEGVWPQLPVGMHWIAIGDKTAKAVQQRVEYLGEVKCAQGAVNSEALLELPELNDIAGEKIVIFRGVGGREYLANELRSRGAIVRYCDLYHRRKPANFIAEFESLNLGSQSDIVTLFSGETLAAYLEAFDKKLNIAKKIPVLVPGHRVAKLAKNAGLEIVIEAESAAEEKMSQALFEFISDRYL